MNIIQIIHFYYFFKFRKDFFTGGIIPYYQPVIDCATGGLCGVEVLVRWRLTSGKLISPDVFVPWIEKEGLMPLLTRQVLNQVKKDISEWDRLPSGFHVSINIPASENILNCLDGDFSDFNVVFGDRVKLILEFTERTDMDINSDFVLLVEKMKRSGIIVSLDDFGTGYSNLIWLDSLPVDCIKIDKIFVHSLIEGDDSLHMVDDIIYLAKRRDIFLIAEGVENYFQSHYLTSRGVRLQQGFLWSPPLSGHEFLEYMATI